MTNIPAPSGPRAPLGHRWLWWIGPPLMLTLVYRMIPGHIRRLWNPKGGATSHLAVTAIRSGGGWRAFVFYALPLYGKLTEIHHRIADPNMWWLPQPGGSK